MKKDIQVLIQLQIEKSNHLEHFKHAKDLAMIYPVNHPKRVPVEKELNKITENIQKLEK